jgi:hypothetical protein
VNAQRREVQIKKWHEQQVRIHKLAAFKRLYWQFLLFVVVYTITIVGFMNQN